MGNAPAFPFFLWREGVQLSGSIRLDSMRYLRTSWQLALVVAALACAGAGQTGASAPKAKPVSPFAAYSGEWTAAFNGNVWLRFRLQMQGDTMTGSIERPRSVALNDNGELKSVSDERSTEQVTSAEVNPDGLVLTAVDSETKETTRYMMKLIPPANDVADVKVIAMAMPPGMPKPKPWRVSKTSASHGQP